MNPRTRLNLVLLVIVAALVAVTVFEPGHKAPLKNDKLLDLKPAQIDRFVITRGDKPAIVLVRRGSDWWLDAPLKVRAAEFRVNPLLSLGGLEGENSLNIELSKLAQYGLSPARLSVSVNGKAAIKFGNRTPIDYRRYVLFKGKVYALDDTLFRQLDGDYASFVSRALLPGRPEVTAMQLPGLKLALNGGKWSATPQPKHFSVDQVTPLIDAWRYNQAYQVKIAADLHSGEPVSIRLKDSAQPLHFLIQARKPDLVLVRPDLKLAYHFADSAAKDLLHLAPANPPKGKESSAENGKK